MAGNKRSLSENLRARLNGLGDSLRRATPRRNTGKSSTARGGRRPAARGDHGLDPIGRVREVLASLPEGTDEIAAIMLLVFGVVSILALLNVSPDTAVTSSWAQAIRQLFGLGSFVVAIGILGLAVVILLPKLNLGVHLHFAWPRVLAIEIAFMSFLALLHLLANDPEPRALARVGGGGGYIGWALSQLLTGLFDPIFASVVYGIIFILAFSRAVGLKRSHVSQGMGWIVGRLGMVAERLEVRAERLETEALKIPEAALPGALERRSRPSIVPRPLPAEQPHVRPLKQADSDAALDEDDVEPADHEDDADQGDEAGWVGRSRLPYYIQPDNERLERGLSSPGIPGERPSIVPRDADDDELRPAVIKPKKQTATIKKVRDSEGKLVRYFSTDDLQETRRVGKRSEQLPPYNLLDDNDLNRPMDEEVNKNARIIEETLREFDIHVEVIDVKIGPSVTQYAVQPFKEMVNEDGEHFIYRVRVGRIAALERDLALALSAKRLRIQAPVPGTSYVGVEVPNKEPSIVSLRGVVESATFYRHRSPLALPLGRDVSGASVVADLATMPHLLIAGTTGAGKSVTLTSIASSLVMNNTPDRLKLVLLDPKMVELTRFNGLPHLMGPVEFEQERIIGVLRWAAREMDRRYKLLEVAAARNIEIYNRALGKRRKDEHLPYIVLIFDEIGDLMLSRPEETEKILARLAQMARAVGIHLIVATQRPSVDVITGLIKANFPARISFAVASGIDSRVILDVVGAETLMGRGDMLYMASDAAGPKRIQGCYVSDEELERLIEYWSAWTDEQVEAGTFGRSVAPWERGMTRREILSETDPMLEEAIQLILEAGEASASLLQRRMGVGYPRAARLMDLMQELGIIGQATKGGRTREVLYGPGDDPFRQIVDKRVRGQDD